VLLSTSLTGMLKCAIPLISAMSFSSTHTPWGTRLCVRVMTGRADRDERVFRPSGHDLI
jgi:hypothetical protein